MGHSRGVASRYYEIPAQLPVVWTGPASIQVGISPPLARLTDIPNDATPLIHALTNGISESGLTMLAAQRGVSPGWVATLLEALRPVFNRDTPVSELPQWRVWSATSAGHDIARVGRALGLDLVAANPSSDELTGPAATVLVADYVHHPHWVNELTRWSHPHLPVVFSDQEVLVGPVITPGVTPCLMCLESHRRETTPFWLEMGSQLWGRESPLHTPAIHGVVGSLILGFLTGSLGWEEASLSREAVFRPPEQTTTWRDISFHPSCACRGVSAGTP